MVEFAHQNTIGQCGCGNSKKYKNCCQKFIRFQIRSRIEEGNLRPDISTDFQGRKVVAVGSRVIILPPTSKTFHEFLLVYIRTLLGKDWIEEELKKPIQEQHQLIEWNKVLTSLIEDAPKTNSGEPKKVVMTGMSAAYMSLAYQLYLMDHNLLLEDKHLERLRVKDQFQGVLYEIFLISSFIRAGYNLNYEDEKDKTRKHCEFTATCKIDGSRFSVEGKSKHRSGVMGFSGEKKDENNISLSIRRLLFEAFKKPANYRRVIFIDVNLPPEKKTIRDIKKLSWFEDAVNTISKREHTMKDSAYIIFTNCPRAWVDIKDQDPGQLSFATHINIPGLMADKYNPKEKYINRHFFKIQEAVSRLTYVPNIFYVAVKNRPSFSTFYSQYSKASKEQLLKNMKEFKNIEFLKTLSQEELAFIYCDCIERDIISGKF